jgi:hypothetical protein
MVGPYIDNEEPVVNYYFIFVKQNMYHAKLTQVDVIFCE